MKNKEKVDAGVNDFEIDAMLDYLEKHKTFKRSEVRQAFNHTSDRPTIEMSKFLLGLKILVKAKDNNQNILNPDYDRDEAIEAIAEDKPLTPKYEIASQ